MQLKAYAYITRMNGDLLVFRHVDFPEAGIQVPGGSVDPGETPERAAVREACEETGLNALEVVRFVGETIFSQTVSGQEKVMRRFFYHLHCAQETPPRWLAGERNPSDGTMAKVFECYWAASDTIPPLAAEMGIFLHMLRQA